MFDKPAKVHEINFFITDLSPVTCKQTMTVIQVSTITKKTKLYI